MDDGGANTIRPALGQGQSEIRWSWRENIPVGATSNILDGVQLFIPYTHVFVQLIIILIDPVTTIAALSHTTHMPYFLHKEN